MAGIIFYYENSDIDVWSGKKLDAWHYAAKAAGDISDIIIINLSDKIPECPSKEYNFKIVKSLDEALILTDGEIAQVVCPWNFEKVIELWDFNHIIDWYLFGPADGWQSKDVSKRKLTIPMAKGGGALHSCHAANIVLAHRYGVLR